jgi:aminopeptidase N
VDSFFLDGIQMTIGSITVNGQPARYHADSAGITVIPEKPLRWNTDDSVTIDYAAKPAKVSILLAGTTRITSVVNRSGARARRSTTAFGSLCMMNPIIS